MKAFLNLLKGLGVAQINCKIMGDRKKFLKPRMVGFTISKRVRTKAGENLHVKPVIVASHNDKMKNAFSPMNIMIRVELCFLDRCCSEEAKVSVIVCELEG